MAIGAASATTCLPSLYPNKYQIDNPAQHPGPKVEEQKKAVGPDSGMSQIQSEVVLPHEPFKAESASLQANNNNRVVVGGLVDVFA